MSRLVILVLVAINALYFGWSHWATPDQPVLTAVASTGQQGRKTPGSQAAPPPCASLGPFHDEMLADKADKQLATAGWHPRRRATSEQISDGWWVYVPSTTAAAQARALGSLHSAGLRDAFALTADDPEFRISVGLFSDEARAKERAVRIERLRLDVVVKERHKQQPVIWFDLPGVAREALGNGRLEATGLPLDGLQVEACPATPGAPASQPAEAAPRDNAADTDKTGRTGLASRSVTRDNHSPRV